VAWRSLHLCCRFPAKRAIYYNKKSRISPQKGPTLSDVCDMAEPPSFLQGFRQKSPVLLQKSHISPQRSSAWLSVCNHLFCRFVFAAKFPPKKALYYRKRALYPHKRACEISLQQVCLCRGLLHKNPRHIQTYKQRYIHTCVCMHVCLLVCLFVCMHVLCWNVCLCVCFFCVYVLFVCMFCLCVCFVWGMLE